MPPNGSLTTGVFAKASVPAGHGASEPLAQQGVAISPAPTCPWYLGAMRVHLVDGTFELFRAHFSKRPRHAAPDGREAKATVGLAASLLALLHDAREDVTHVAVAFDNPIRSFRNDLLAGYKGDEGVPPELRAQFDRAEEVSRALGLVTWSMREYEADDALATAAARFRDGVAQVRIFGKPLRQDMTGPSQGSCRVGNFPLRIYKGKRNLF